MIWSILSEVLKIRTLQLTQQDEVSWNISNFDLFSELVNLADISKL